MTWTKLQHRNCTRIEPEKKIINKEPGQEEMKENLAK